MEFITKWCFLIAVLQAAIAMKCLNKPDGVYEHGCRMWTKCTNGVANTTECSPPKVFDSRTEQCEDPSKVPPPCGMMKDCTNISDGKYADTDQNCHTYYTCSGGIFFGHNFCPDDRTAHTTAFDEPVVEHCMEQKIVLTKENEGTVFNEKLQSCDWPQDTPPPCGTLKLTSPSP